MNDTIQKQPPMFCKKGVLRNFAKFTGKHLCLSLFFNETPFLQNTSGRLLLTIGIRLLIRLHLGFSHWQEHKFRHNFKVTMNPFSSCSIEAKSTSHFFLRCYLFHALQETLMNVLRNIDTDLSSLCYENRTDVLLYSKQEYDDNLNQIILMHVMRYIKSSERFKESLFDLCGA